MYLGGLLAILTAPLWNILSPRLSIIVGFLFLIPTAIDGTTQMFGERESTNRLRSITGFILGVGTVMICYGAVTVLLNLKFP